MLKELKENPVEPILAYAATISDPCEHENLMQYANAAKEDPVGGVRALVKACGESGERQREFKGALVRGAETKMWISDSCPSGVPVLQLLHDCETRWCQHI